ncbi:MAG: hypothetical protein V8Q80_00420 [Barnesiella intestinihominis]
MTIEADDSSPERLTIGWRSSRYGIVYTLTGFIEDDGCLHISIGEQQLGSYGAYTMMLEGLGNRPDDPSGLSARDITHSSLLPLMGFRLVGRLCTAVHGC